MEVEDIKANVSVVVTLQIMTFRTTGDPQATENPAPMENEEFV